MIETILLSLCFFHPQALFAETQTISKKTPPAGFVARDESHEDRVIVKAEADLKIEQAKNDSTLAPTDLQAKQQTIAKLDAVVTARVAENPDSFAANNSASGFYLQKGDNKKAEELAGKALALAEAQGKPSLAARALVNRGLARFAEDRSAAGYHAAHADGCGALKLDPKSRAALELCKYTETRSFIDPQTERSLADTTGEFQEISRRYAALQNPGVSHSLDEWSSRCAGNPAPLCRAEIGANESLVKGDLASALRQSESALQLDSTDPFAYFQRGIARWKLKDANGAILDYTQAISRGWIDDNLYSNRAEALLAVKSYSAAIRDANMAVALNPGSASAHYTRAKIKLGLRLAPEKVYEDLYAAARLDPVKYEEERQKFLKALPDPEKLASWTPPDQNSAAWPAAAAQDDKGVGPTRGPFPAFGPLVSIGLGVIGALALFGLFSLWRGKSPQTSDSHLPKPTGGSLAPVAEDRRIAGRYEVEERIGQGGMGEVFRAKDHNLDRMVAIKVPSGLFSSAPGFFDSIETEAKALLALGAHTNVVQFFDVVREKGRIYLILELVRGKTLEAAILERPAKRLPLSEVIQIMAQVCAALDFAHKKRVIHRDLKPSNIMLTGEEGLVKVMDFGIARAAKDTHLKTTGTVCGTSLYMAPEALFGRTSAQSDVYSLGVCAYEMLTGKLPFNGPAQVEAKRLADYDPATKTAPGLPATIDDFFRKAFEPEPAKRLQGAPELIAALRETLRGATPSREFS